MNAPVLAPEVARDRYHTISITPGWRLTTVRAARALVVGGGAIGNEVLKNLAMLGLHAIAIVDRDTVEAANLSRSVFFRERDHGRPKSEVLAERIRELNPDVQVLPLVGDLESVLGLGLLRRMDMVFSCLDNRLARQTLNRMCRKLAKPWVDGATESLLGDVSVYLPDQGPCYECGFTAVDREIIAEARSCKFLALQQISGGRVPTTSTMSSIIGGLMVQEGLRLLHGTWNGPVASKRLVVNCGAADFYLTQSARREDCEGHFRFGAVRERPGWSAATTTARAILDEAAPDAAGPGHLRLGHNMVIAVRCHRCGTEAGPGKTLRRLTEDEARCPQCHEVRDPEVTNLVRGGEPYADWPLQRLCVPPLDIVEVRTSSGPAWYELTGDLADLPEAFR